MGMKTIIFWLKIPQTDVLRSPVTQIPSGFKLTEVETQSKTALTGLLAYPPVTPPPSPPLQT